MKQKLKWIGNILTILSLAFIVYAVWKLGLDFSSITNVPVFILVMLVGVAGKTGTVFLSGTVWNSWLSFFAGKKGDLREAYYVYTKANTGKYLPGNVMQYVERNLFADKLGVDQKRVAASSLIEVVSLVLVALLTALLFSSGQLSSAVKAVADALGGRMIVLIVAVVALVLAGAVVLLVIFRKKLAGVLKDYRMTDFIVRLIASMAGQAVVLSILGLIFVMLYIYMGGKVSFGEGMAIVSGYIISWVLGFIVPGAPGGIGIREMVLTLLVGSIVGQKLVVTIALIHRLITIVGDFLAYLIGIVFCKSKT